MEKIEALLRLLQDSRAQLESWGITSTHLIYVAGAASVLFLLSMREVLGWYLKTNALKSEIRLLRGQIDELRYSVEALRSPIDPSDAGTTKTPPEEPVGVKKEASRTASPSGELKIAASAKGKPFRLDH